MKVTAELIDYLKSENAKTRIWMDAEEGRWASFYSEKPEHWAEDGIYTIEDFKCFQLRTFIWDAYKDAHGIRPRWIDFDSMSLSELEDMADRVSAEAEETYLREKAKEAEYVESFKQLISRTIEMGAKDKETALRWLTADYNFYGPQDIEHWVWNYGILFSDYGKELVEELMEIVTFKEWKAG